MEFTIKEYHLEKPTEQETLLSALRLEQLSAPIISVVGGGGKTTVIKRLAAEYKKRQRPIIVTTTTHMQMPKEQIVLTSPNIELLATLLTQRKVVWLGTPQDDGKIASFPMPFLEACRMLHVPILIEADGAKGMPCKCPAEHEPVIWGKTTVVLGVVGLDAVGEPIANVCHRPECVEEVLQKDKEDTLTCEDIVRISLNENGMKKGMDPYMRFHVILNKADCGKRMAIGEETAQLFLKNGFRNVCLTSGLLPECMENENEKYAIVVLAAGEAKRFGSNKLLTDIEGAPMYRRMITQLNKIHKMLKIIVTGYEQIKQEAGCAGITVVDNEEPEFGISHSMKLGLAKAVEMNPRLQGVLFTVCDQPELLAETLSLLLDTAKENPHSIICASEGGRRRNPVVWSNDYFEELLTLTGDAGGRQILDKYNEDVVFVEIDAIQLKDVDRKEDIRVY